MMHTAPMHLMKIYQFVSSHAYALFEVFVTICLICDVYEFISITESDTMRWQAN